MGPPLQEQKNRVYTNIALFFVFFTLFSSNIAAKTLKNENSAVAGCETKTDLNFSQRFFSSYKDHLNYNPENSPALTHNQDTIDAPLDSPPFPSATWSIGGTPPLGYADSVSSPLTDAIYCGKNGQKIKDLRLKLYGWIEPGINFSSSKGQYNIANGNGGNYPAGYYHYANQLLLNQATLYFERTPDTVQKSDIDYGFRIAALYGTDYKYTFSNKLLSNQYLKDRNKYGFDPVMFYGDIYVPFVAKGMNIRIGRYLSVPDIESQPAVNNYMYSHSLLYSFDPFTKEGVMTSIKLNKNWIAQFELTASPDVTIFDKKNRRLTPGACLNWTSDSGNDSIYPCINGMNSGKYGYNNLQMLVTSWYHKFSNKFHSATEGYYMWQRNVPSVSDENSPTLIKGTNGAHCKAGDAKCKASVFAVANYLAYKLNAKNSLILRNEFFKDNRGQRTGYKTLYTQHTIAFNHWIGDVITIRPEFRFDHSYDVKAYDGGRKASQYVVAADMIVRF